MQMRRDLYLILFLAGVLFLENNDMKGPLPADFADLDWSKWEMTPMQSRRAYLQTLTIVASTLHRASALGWKRVHWSNSGEDVPRKISFRCVWTRLWFESGVRVGSLR